jgi:GNAT superfamily N-acetyltransferase
MPLDVRPVDSAAIPDLATLFSSDKATAGCWCMWFIIPVKAYHAAGGDGNRAGFRDLMASNPHPMGLVAYEDGEPAGWCALGPRSRFARAIKTPTYTGRDPAEDDSVWLIPCLFLRRESRKSGLSEQLVRAAVRLARERGATALEAFPLSSHERRAKDTQVGFEPVFARCGFSPLRRPSDARVVMRMELPNRPNRA